MNYYIFRIDYSNVEYFENNLKKGILRQGWGLENLSLLNKEGEIRETREWIEACPESWRITEKDRIYLKNKNNNLKKMLEMKEGDIILIPKFPKHYMFSLYRVKGRYFFEMEEGYDDYGHCIPVEIAKVKDEESDKYFVYNGNDLTKIVHSKLRGYQRTINSISDKEVIGAIKNLLQMKSIDKEQTTSDILRDIFKKNIKTMDNLNKKFFSFRPNDIEDIVEEIFEKQGYIVESRNRYNRKGGDSDRTFIKSLPILSEIDDEIGSCKIYVQIKKKDGICDETEGVEQLEKIVEDECLANEMKQILNIYKVLVCTGEFTPRIKELARDKGVILIDGVQLIRLCLRDI